MVFVWTRSTQTCFNPCLGLMKAHLAICCCQKDSEVSLSGPNFPYPWITLLAISVNWTTAAHFTHQRRFYPNESLSNSICWTSVMVRVPVFPSWHQVLTNLLTLRLIDIDDWLHQNFFKLLSRGPPPLWANLLVALGKWTSTSSTYPVKKKTLKCWMSWRGTKRGQ